MVVWYLASCIDLSVLFCEVDTGAQRKTDVDVIYTVGKSLSCVLKHHKLPLRHNDISKIILMPSMHTHVQHVPHRSYTIY